MNICLKAEICHFGRKWSLCWSRMGSWEDRRIPASSLPAVYPLRIASQAVESTRGGAETLPSMPWRTSIEIRREKGRDGLWNAAFCIHWIIWKPASTKRRWFMGTELEPLSYFTFIASQILLGPNYILFLKALKGLSFKSIPFHYCVSDIRDINQTKVKQKWEVIHIQSQHILDLSQCQLWLPSINGPMNSRGSLTCSTKIVFTFLLEW